MTLPSPPGGAPTSPPSLRPDTLALWRVWHPTSYTPTATTYRDNGPRARFDPHPPGPPVDHLGGSAVWYGSLLFDTAVRETLARGPLVVDICSAWRGTLVAVTRPALFDLTDPAVCAALGADPALGDTLLDDAGYEPTQAWARHLKPGSDGLRYHSARHRNARGGRHGINYGLWEPARTIMIVAQHRLVDDTLWPHAAAALDAAGTAFNLVPDCPSCRA